MNDKRFGLDLVTEGSIEPKTGKDVMCILHSDGKILIFLDGDFEAEWLFVNDPIDGYGGIVNRLAYLEAISNFLNRDPDKLLAVRRLIAEGLARLLVDEDVHQATAVMDVAEKQIRLLNAQYTKIWYTTLLLMILILGLSWSAALWSLRDHFVDLLTPAVLDIGVSLGLVPLGVFASVITRQGTRQLDANAGFGMHFLACLGRLTTGVVTAIMAMTLVNMGWLFPKITQSTDRLSLFVLLAILGGASERALPEMVDQFDHMVVRGIQQKGTA